MLTQEQKDSFAASGYLRLQGIVPAWLISKLRTLFDELMIPDEASEKTIYEFNGKKYITNLENLCPKGNLSCLELLGYPPILEIAKLICGPDLFLIQEFAVIKNLGDNLPVFWHQDMAHQRKGSCFTMGIYLDDARENDGALRVVPGSHLSNKNICELSKEPSAEVPMQAGDILIHDMMLAHSSGTLTQNLLRRVIYFEFLSATHVATEHIYTPELVQRRSRLHFAATRYYQSLHPLEKQFIHSAPNHHPEDEQKEIIEILQEIYSQQTKARPSTYCFDNLVVFPGL